MMARIVINVERPDSHASVKLELLGVGAIAEVVKTLELLGARALPFQPK